MKKEKGWQEESKQLFSRSTSLLSRLSTTGCLLRCAYLGFYCVESKRPYRDVGCRSRYGPLSIANRVMWVAGDRHVMALTVTLTYVYILLIVYD